VFETIDSVLREHIAPKAAVSLLMERFTREEGLDFSHFTNQNYADPKAPH
jgi:hypothetical protein